MMAFLNASAVTPVVKWLLASAGGAALRAAARLRAVFLLAVLIAFNFKVNYRMNDQSRRQLTVDCRDGQKNPALPAAVEKNAPECPPAVCLRFSVEVELV
jgi:hypothetical protein